jgi:hypothetical protein
MKYSPSKRNLPGPYSDDIKKLLIEIHKSHVTAESKKLYFFFTDMEDIGAEEHEILEVLEEYKDKPGFGLGYIKAVLVGKVQGATSPADAFGGNLVS